MVTIPRGLSPTGIGFPMTWFVAASTTVTLSEAAVRDVADIVNFLWILVASILMLRISPRAATTTHP